MIDFAKRGLARAGFQVRRLSEEERALAPGYDVRVPLPPQAYAELQPANPRLRALEQRYAQCQAEVCAHTQWASELQSTATDLQYFRGDNAYLWQYSRSPEINRLRYFIYGRYIQSRDSRRLLDLLDEDGAFGCFTFQYADGRKFSRDLLDSVNELCFLGEHWGLFDRPSVRVADIGAGYGRLAHRMCRSSAQVQQYWCLDALPRSTFLCEYYLRHREIDNATVVPVDELAQVPKGLDLAINIHSFSEMGRAAIRGWMRWLAEREVPTLLIVPNEGEQILSREQDGSRRDCSDLLAEAGYKLRVSRPTIEDPAVRQLFGVADHFMLFERG